jgi:hypothetical protein
MNTFTITIKYILCSSHKVFPSVRLLLIWSHMKLQTQKNNIDIKLSQKINQIYQLIDEIHDMYGFKTGNKLLDLEWALISVIEQYRQHPFHSDEFAESRKLYWALQCLPHLRVLCKVRRQNRASLSAWWIPWPTESNQDSLERKYAVMSAEGKGHIESEHIPKRKD